MTERIRCTSCGATEPAGAGWCGQCLTPFAVVPPDTASPSTAPDAPPPGVPPAPTPDGAADAAARDVRTVDGEVEWRCAACDGWNPLLAVRCTRCGTERTGFGTAAEVRGRPVAALGLRVATSAVLPGLGHLLSGRAGTGTARLLLWLLWAAGGVGLLGGPLAPAAVLLLGAAVLWATTLADVVALPDGPERLGARPLGALTAAVTVGLVVASLAAPPG